MKKLRSVSFVVLFLLGAFEVFYGAFAGRVGVTQQARLLRADLQPLDFTDTHARAFAQHFGELKVQWGIVTYFGIATFAIGVVLLMLERKKS
jgi:hypothetical protein